MEQKWTHNNILTWAQRICKEKLPDNVGLGADIFEGIESSIDALKAERDALQQRVKELVTVAATSREIINTCMEQCDALGAENARLNAEAQRWNERYHEASAQLTAHTATEQWETAFDWCDTHTGMQACVNKRASDGWEYVDVKLLHNGSWMVVMQRPARQGESE